MSLDPIRPILIKTKSPLSIEEFHQQVNVVFHDFESDNYDQIHKDMWEILVQQFNLIAADLVNFSHGCQGITLMDVGCGTGLGSELFMATDLGKLISEIILVDVSPKMIQKAKERSKNWNVKVITHQGMLAEAKYKADIILTSSVLHHIPDYPKFLLDVDRHLRDGGLFIHIHDPNGDQLLNPVLVNRRKEIASTDKIASLYQLLNRSEFLKAIFQRINRMRGKFNHIDLVNNQLLKSGVIKKRMSAKEIWSITDIHVEGLPHSTQKGISLKEIGKVLQGYELLSHRSYGFFGRLGFELSQEYQSKEQSLIKSGSKEGRYLAAAWKKKNE